MARLRRSRASPPTRPSSPRAAEPGGWDGLRYFRLHGSPVTCRSSYGDAFLRGDWCIFDNTASGEALGNALALLAMVT